jgi:hypothetical protein
MIPLSDGIPARRFPYVNVALIVANFAVWLLYELPHLNSSVFHASFYPCTVTSACHGPEPWELSWFTAMFMHGSWDHILGNMLFLAIFGKNVEDAFGHLRYLAFYVAGGFVASMTQALVTLLAGSAVGRCQWRRGGLLRARRRVRVRLPRRSPGARRRAAVTRGRNDVTCRAYAQGMARPRTSSRAPARPRPGSPKPTEPEDSHVRRPGHLALRLQAHP